MAAGLEDGSLVVFDGSTGQPQRYAAAAPNAYWGDVAWSPTGDRVACQFTGPQRGDPIYVVDLATSTVSQVPDSWSDGRRAPQLAWSPEGAAIWAILGEGCGRSIDVETGRARAIPQDRAVCQPGAAAWSPDGRLLAVSSSEGGVNVVDRASEQTLRTLAGKLNTFPQSQTGRLLFFDPAGKWLATRGGVSMPGPASPLIVWEVATGRPVAQLGGQGSAHPRGILDSDRMAAAFDGERLVCLYENGEITRWPFTLARAEEAVIARLPAIRPQPQMVWSANGQRIAAANAYGGAAVWHAPTGQLVALFPSPLDAPILSADGSLVALADREKSQEVIYDLAAGRVIRTLPEASPGPQGAGFSPDGRLIAYGSGNRALVAEVATGRQVARLDGYPEGQSIQRVLWSPDGMALLAATGGRHSEEAGTVILWQRGEDGTFQELFRSLSVLVGSSRGEAALFNPCGNLVAFVEMARPVANSSEVRIFDRQAGKVILTVPMYTVRAWASDEVVLIDKDLLTQLNVRSGEQTVGRYADMSFDGCYAPGAAYYASHGRGLNSDQSFTILDWQTGEVLASATHGSGLLQMAWSPDGHRITSLGVDGTIKVWPVNP